MNSSKKRTHAGIDASKATLEACKESKAGQQRGKFDNNAAGFCKLIKWIGRNSRVCVEATGVYHLQLCLALRKAGIEVMVINPRVARKFAESLSVRTKTDRVDAWTLLEYVKRMDFIPWEAPAPEVLELRDLARRLDDLVQAASDEKKRRHSFIAGGATRAVRNDVEINIAHLNRRIKQIEKTAVGVVRAHEWIFEQFKTLKTVTGIGTRTAILLLAELLPLDPEMTTREITAYAGLDPREEQSGSSVHKTPRISRVGNARLRAMLFLPAMTLARRDVNAAHFRDRLVGRGKKKMQAIVAIMRKLLHAVWTMMHRGTAFASARLFPVDAAAVQLSLGQRSAMTESPDSVIASTQPESKASHPKGRSEAEERQLDSSQTEATGGGRKARAAA